MSKSDTASVARWIVIILILCGMGGMLGCEQSQQRPVWGDGDPPDSWTETFGNDNGARINFVQMQMLSDQAARIKRLEEFCRISNGTDPNESR